MYGLLVEHKAAVSADRRIWQGRLVNLEPDFWGYASGSRIRIQPSLRALVTINPDCASLSNDIVGVAGCLIKMARQYGAAGLHRLSTFHWGGDSVAEVVTFMQAVGAQHADFIVMQTMDRDAGCFEINPQPSDCARGDGSWYWTRPNQTTPNFNQHLANVQQ